MKVKGLFKFTITSMARPLIVKNSTVSLKEMYPKSDCDVQFRVISIQGNTVRLLCSLSDNNPTTLQGIAESEKILRVYKNLKSISNSTIKYVIYKQKIDSQNIKINTYSSNENFKQIMRFNYDESLGLLIEKYKSVDNVLKFISVHHQVPLSTLMDFKRNSESLSDLMHKLENLYSDEFYYNDAMSNNQFIDYNQQSCSIVNVLSPVV